MLSSGRCERCGDNDHREEGGDQAGNLYHVKDRQVQPSQTQHELYESQLQGCQNGQTKESRSYSRVNVVGVELYIFVNY